HRDLKPDNVFLLEQDGKQDFVKIVDFGIAKAAERDLSTGDSEGLRALSSDAMSELEQQLAGTGSSNITMAGTVMGTPGYMAPEQIQGHPQDARVDQYALGCLLYEMLSGQQVFTANGPMTLMLRHASDPVTTLAERLADVPGVTGIPDSLDQLVCRLLSKEPHERFASMTDLAQALEREIELMQLQRGERTVVPTELVQSISQPPVSQSPVSQSPVSQSPVSQPAVPDAPFWRQPLLIALLGLALIFVATAGALWGLRQNQGAGSKLAQELVLKPGELVAWRKSALAVLSQQAQQKTDGGLAAGALVALGRSRDSQQRQILEATLTDARADAVLRAAAAEALGFLGERAALSALHKAVEGLGDAATVANSPELASLRVAVAAALRQLGDSRGGVLLGDALRDSDPVSSLRAALLLCSKEPAALREVLQSALSLPQLPDALRWDVLACLSRLGDGSATATLQGLAGMGTAMGKTAAEEPRIAALARLAQAGDAQALSLLRGLASRRNTHQLVAAQELAQLEQDDILPLLREALADSSASPAARQLASTGLAAVGRPMDARTLGQALERLHASSAADPGVEALKQSIAAAIVQIVAREPALLARNGLGWARSAFADRSWANREAAAAVLGDTSGGEPLRLLTELLRDSNSKVRQSAARALGRRSEPDALLTLRSAYADSDSDVRKESLRATERLISALGLAKRGQVGPVSVVDTVAAVRPLFEQGSSAEQVAAAAVLLRLADKAAQDRVRTWRSTDDAGMRRLYFARLASERDELLAGLKDTVLAVRLAAAERLVDRHGETVQKDALPVLQEAVRAGGEEAVAAYALLVRLGDRSTVTAPEQALLSGATGDRLAAIEAMARLPHGQAVPLLLRAARDPESLVRRLVAEVAADLGEASGNGQAAAAGALAPGVPVLRVLVGDVDPVVRSRAESLLGRLLQQSSTPERQAAIAELLQDAPPVGKAAPETDTRGAAQAGSPSRDGGSGSADGGADSSATEPTTAGERGENSDGKNTARPKPLAAEPFARAGLDAFAASDFKKSQRLLERAHALCGRDRKHAAECAVLVYETSYRLGQIYEQQKALPEAMAEYQTVLRTSTIPRGKAELRSAAQQAVSRLSARLGQVIVRSPGKPGSKKACEEVTMWMRPGPALIKVGGKLEPIEVRSQAVTHVGLCP
ncbi:MAG: HEAT repeat domain-containing protein, partial [Myxococcales bacterium]|nr:HEAT repeat domain-containing protein [Myxococcales bacterium]